MLGSPPATADLVVVPGTTLLPHGADLWAVGGKESNERDTGWKKRDKDHKYHRVLRAETLEGLCPSGLLDAQAWN